MPYDNAFPSSDESNSISDIRGNEDQNSQLHEDDDYCEGSQESVIQNQLGDKVAYAAYLNMFEGN